MDTFQNWTRNIEAPVVEFASPKDLAELCSVVRAAEGAGLPVHAVGSAWSYSAPAHCAGVVVRTDGLADFPPVLQQAVRPGAGEGRLWLAVGGGITLRNLSLALDGAARPDGRPGVPAELRNGRRWTLPTLGGSGGQTLAGAIATGTHGGDAARGPIGDYVRALVVVGSGGQVTIAQDQHVVDVPAYEQALRAAGQLPPEVTVREFRHPRALAAAVVGLGRFGVVHAAVLEVHDETEVALVEHRRASTWRTVRADLTAAVDRAVAGDEFLSVVVNPVARPDGDRKVLVSTRKSLQRTDLAAAGRHFGLGDQASTPVLDERARTGMPAELGQALCAKELPGPLHAIARILGLSTDRRLGDFLADLLNATTALGLPQLVETATSAVIDAIQPTARPSDHKPWLVHGTRWEVGDFFDYSSDCYRMDFVELFFPVNDQLPARVDEVIGVFEQLRARGVALGGYLSLRFLRGSQSLLAPACFDRTCALEVAMPRGLTGNRAALALLHELAQRHGGFLHWGQLNELDAASVAGMFGGRLGEWRSELRAWEGTASTFGNAFTRGRGLEPDRAADWTQWTDAGIAAGGPPALVGRLPFVVGRDRLVHTADRLGGTWRAVRPEPVGAGARPLVLASARRLEVFVADPGGRVLRARQGADGQFPAWQPLAGEGLDGDVHGAAHLDGRIEVVARGDFQRGREALHAWPLVGELWNGLTPMASGRLGGPPSVGLRSVGGSDQLVVVAAGERGYVRWSAQHGPGSTSPWTAWQDLGAVAGSHPVVFRAPDGVARVVVVDGAGRGFEAVELTGQLAVRWQPWRALPDNERLDPSTVLTPAGAWLFGLGLDGRLLASRLDGSGWSAWQDLGGHFTSPVAASASSEGVLVAGVRADTGQLVYRAT
ncbi:hypothetical protein JOF53_000627 [Crossiella equi]|uniref:FAD-binding PCMH-type domain-containing protein n=1 Tax=Crossiella equi TaxID=130796 RepID=A0ABS5A587_9PSEU|nr:FAD-binding oxidoreductase [Crossiella equi]MBP2471755.1 hypothetical protein [Crossiella equi]